MQRLYRGLAVAALAFGCLSLAGCGPARPTVIPVGGKVLYRGKPLTSGGVMFQPSAGQPARGEIQADGTFQLSTFGNHDGAIVGSHRVRVWCNSSQGKVPGGELTVGKSLIPEQYDSFDTSGITVEVQPDLVQPVVIELKDEPAAK